MNKQIRLAVSLIIIIALSIFLFGIETAKAEPFAYVTNRGSNDVSVIDTVTNMVVGPPIPVGESPEAVAITPDGRRAYVTNFASNDVSVIDTTTNMVVDTITVGSSPAGVAITPDGSRAYVINVQFGVDLDNVCVIDTATNMVVDTITVGIAITGIAITPDGSRAYVVDSGTGDNSIIDTATNMVVGIPIPVGGIPIDIAIIPPQMPRNVPTLSEWGLIAMAWNFGNSGIYGY
jgi:YVTN family beta-propeller protein